MAGQTLYTPARHEAYVEAIRKGMYRNQAAKLIGVSPNAVYRWLRDSEHDPDSPYRKLWEDVEQAEAAVELEMIEKVRDAALSGKPNTWQAAMTFLERKAPERWGRNDRVTVEGGQPIQVLTHHVLANPDDAQLLLNRLTELTAASSRRELTAGDDNVIEGEAVEAPSLGRDW